MRLALATASLVMAVGPGWADVPRCMAMAHVHTSAIDAPYTMQDGETLLVTRIEQGKNELALCGANRACWPSIDFDFVTPCTATMMHGRTVDMK